MKKEFPLPRLIALAFLAVLLPLTSTGCVSTRYKAAPKDTPPPRTLNVTFAPGTLEAALVSLITYNGPGSWKRDAFWDEYVVTLRNSGIVPLLVSDPGLVEFTGASRAVGSEPWALEKSSKTLERQYKDAGIAFVRYTAPGALIFGTGMAVALANTPFFATWGPATASAGAGNAIAAATLVALPVYYGVVLTINHHNKIGMEKEFNRRRLVLPLLLAPGETRTGSLFFPMVPNPRSLRLAWAAGSTRGESVLPLDFLHGLHAAPAKAP